MFSYIEVFCKKSKVLLKEEAFTEREALMWLIINSDDGNLSHTLRSQAATRKWHRSKVERFLTKLQADTLITKTVKLGKLHIILNRNHNILSSYDSKQHSKQITDRSITSLVDGIEDNLPISKKIKNNKGK